MEGVLASRFSRVISRGLLSLHFVRSAKHWAKNGDNTCSVHPTRCASNYVMSLNNVIIIIMFKLEDIHQTNVLAKKKSSVQATRYTPAHYMLAYLQTNKKHQIKRYLSV